MGTPHTYSALCECGDSEGILARRSSRFHAVAVPLFLPSYAVATKANTTARSIYTAATLYPSFLPTAIPSS